MINGMFHREMIYHGNQIIIDACEDGNGYEIMVMYPGGKEIESTYTDDLDEAEKIYNGYLGQKSCLTIYTQLISAAKDKDIILLCYERPSEFCHRQLVREWFNNNGFKCEEV